ncbi:MAG: sigma-54-dependent Fis family transcriptional regulator [Psychrobium sp.]|nr:sigma-54-dependent Fis family transcriptional regulator [Psychrobium sp.]
MLESTLATSQLPVLLLVDDDINILAALERTLRGVPANIISYSSPNEALQYCQHNQPQIIISDQKMPQLEGCELLSKIQTLWPGSQRILLSAYQDFENVANGFSSGAIERYICKPWDNKELKFIVNKAISNAVFAPPQHKITTEVIADEPINFHSMIASHASMKALFDNIRQAATSNAPIFVTGETGTGKELVAKACHAESFHQQQPFLAVNCANFTENLMESQLFGHVKGAFTGAIASQEGVFAAAKQGTLFLDEITALSKSLQAKLLRVVQEREFTPLGSTKAQKFHAKLISASSNSIRNAVLDGDFREDLFYRLNIITFSLPALRERGEDKLLIANHYLKRYAKAENKAFQCFSKGCQQIIEQYNWPGNVRQLENIIHGIIILNNGDEINSQMIISALSTTISPLDKQRIFTTMNETDTRQSNREGEGVTPLWLVEKQAIEQAISFCQGNVPQAAALLEVSPSTIYRKKQGWNE